MKAGRLNYSIFETEFPEVFIGVSSVVLVEDLFEDFQQFIELKTVD